LSPRSRRRLSIGTGDKPPDPRSSAHDVGTPAPNLRTLVGDPFFVWECLISWIVVPHRRPLPCNPARRVRLFTSPADDKNGDHLRYPHQGGADPPSPSSWASTTTSHDIGVFSSHQPHIISTTPLHTNAWRRWPQGPAGNLRTSTQPCMNPRSPQASFTSPGTRPDAWPPCTPCHSSVPVSASATLSRSRRTLPPPIPPPLWCRDRQPAHGAPRAFKAFKCMDGLTRCASR